MMPERREDEALGEGGVGRESRATVAPSASVEGQGAPWLWVAVALGLLGLTLRYFSWGPHAVRQLSPSPSPSGIVGGARPTPTAVLPAVTRGGTGASPAATGIPQEEGLPDATEEVPPPDEAATSSPAPEYPPTVDESGFPPAASPPPAFR